MNRLSKMGLICLTLFSLALTFTACDNNVNNKGSEKTMETDKRTNEVQQKLLRHVVLFNFNDKATAEIVKSIEQEFIGLQEKIGEIHSFEWGINNSPEGLDKGLTHCFFVTFLSEEDRKNYLPHPAHQKFVAFIGPYVEDVTVVDYWAS